MDTTGTITNFKTTPGTEFDGVGGDSYLVETAGKSYSITNPDPQTLRFEVQQGDNWAAGGDGSHVDRAEIQNHSTGVATSWGAFIPAGTPIGMDYQFMVEANGPNGSFVNTQNSSNGWFVVGQMHNDDIASGVGTSPPFAVQMNGNHLQIVARYVLPGGNPSNSSSDLHMMTLWTDPNPITPGVYNDIRVQANFSNSGGGYLQVSINGTQVVNYQGPLGYGAGTYWEYGIYRSTAPETAAVDYRNLTLVTGSQATSWTGVGGTTSSGSTTQPTAPTTPTTPTNVAPTVTQVSASPGTGIEHAGDTVTMTLAFSEAVTVTGTPTLSLNDGNTATYMGGSGTSTLTFKTTVAATDTNTSALAITGVNLPTGAGINDASGLAANLSGAVKTFSGLQIDPILPAVTQASASPGSGTEVVGDTITLTLGFNEAVMVTGTPTLSLNDGGTASYVSGSGTGTLTFRTTVASTDTDASALAITGVNLPNGASIKDASGAAANLAGAVKTFSGLQIDPILPAVTQVTASPGTGTEVVGDTITLTLGFNEAVTVSGTPTLSLNDGNVATYVSGSGTSALTFRTTVASTDTTTSALAITAVNLPTSASIKDASGAAANLAGAAKTFPGLQIDPILPAVTQVTASPGSGTEHVGDTVTLTLGFNEAVTVSGTPTLSLNDGAKATYVGGSGTGTLTFRTTVASTDTNTSALAITGVDLLNGASIKDSSGVAANLAGAVNTFTGLQVDPTSPTTQTAPTTPTTPTNVAPTVTQVSASPGTGIEHAGDTVTMTLAFSEAVTVTGTPTLSLNDGNTATYMGGSGTSTLTFKTTVAATDTNTSALAITGVNLPTGAGINDASGLAANLSGAVKTFSGLQIDPILPAVTQASASPGSGTEVVGDTITLTLGFNEAVMVTGTPTLSLNDGDTAAYVSGSGTSALTFRTTVASTDTDASALAITGVNLPNGVSIKDSFGLAASLAGAAKTFSGLQIATSSTTPPTTPTAPSTPSSIAPVLTIANPTLWVAGRGGTVDLGTKVTATDLNDVVTVNIRGLPKYETITDTCDGQTFSGKNVSLTAAQVDSGLTLQSNYRGNAHPVAALTLTATVKDPTTGAVSTASPQTITVTDPRPATTTTSPQPITLTDPPLAPVTSTGFLANQGFALPQQHLDSFTSTLATTAPQAITLADSLPATGTMTASLASQIALLNQYLAADSGRVDPGQMVAAVSHATSWGQDAFLTRPQH